MMNEILAELSREGFNFTELVFDNTVHRNPANKAQWYCGFKNHSVKDGAPFYVVIYGDWHEGHGFRTWTPKGKMSKEDKDQIKKCIEAASKKFEVEKEQLHKDTQVKARERWDQSKDEGSTKYMQRKLIDQLYGARIEGWDLIVPLRDVDGVLWSIQTIKDDGAKFFMQGGKVQGLFHQIGELDDLVLLCEGFATGVSIHQAMQTGVVVCFNASNLVPVAQALKSVYPHKRFLICGDNDKWTSKPDGTPWNPGREFGEKAAKLVLGKCVLPSFVNEEGKPTDFNDLHVREGIARVKEQCTVEVKKYGVYPLGFFGDEYMFTSTENQQIVRIQAFSESQLLNLMPIEFWESAFPGEKSPVNWTFAKSELMRQARAKGIFEDRNVRGSGVWMDEGRIVVNMGDHLMVDGKRMDVNEIRSRNFYTIGRRLPELHHNPLTLEECNLLVEICDTFKWRKTEYAKLIAGLMVVSKICGALPIRPHAWFTGASQAGKSTLLERLVYPTVADFSHYFLGGSSEPGVRQKIGADAVPVIFDEFETNDPRSAQNISACVELMRSAWSESHGGIAKGTTGGTAQFYQPRFAAMVSSIRVNLTTDADRSRFVVMELAPHGNDKEHWKKLSGLLAKYNEEYVQRLFARVVRMIPIILENYKLLRTALLGNLGARHAQQYAMLLAGFGVLCSDAVLTEPEIELLCGEMQGNEDIEDASTPDHQECLEYLMSTRIQLDIGGDRQILTLEQIIQQKLYLRDQYRDALGQYGILLAPRSIFLASSNHKELSSLFRNTKWLNSYIQVLSRIEGAQRSARCSIFGVQRRGLTIPLNELDS